MACDRCSICRERRSRVRRGRDAVSCRAHQTQARDVRRSLAMKVATATRLATARGLAVAAAAGSLISSSSGSLILCCSNHRRPDENRVVIGRALSARN